MSIENTPRPEGLDLSSWQEPENLRWSFQHMDSLFPVRAIGARGPAAELVTDPMDVHKLPVAMPGGVSSTVTDILDATDTDAWLLLHGNRILAEEYRAGMSASSPHLLMSVSKSLVSSVLSTLVDDGRVGLGQRIGEWIPALRGSGYGDATVRQVLDMRSGVRFSEDYLDPQSEVRGLDAAVGWAPPLPGGPGTLREFLAGLEADRPHGGYFQYRSCETDVLGWLCEAVSGRPFPELASEVLWSRVGSAHDAYITADAAGQGMFDGGICATLRDLACFGAMIRDGGRSLTGERVLSEEWVQDIFEGGEDAAEAFAAGPEGASFPGGRYRSQFWFPSERQDVALCLGIHGQMVYIDRSAGLVGVKFSSTALPVDPGKGQSTVALFEAIARELDG
ncbi:MULTISPECIES: serine hydrolase [Arthrobacter]|uniref:Serine hydrolase n=2 Tax=Arthrobacter TaxID=1663 RepID=A0ABU9KFP5_9MICC|nr:serine hydrolase [Arthrobacter sp. YJM1]MDP5225696.1 serine hydrolase [Arthrobacter sp. YJM1]